MFAQTFLFSLSSLLLSILTDGGVTEINVMLLTAVHRLAGGMDENKRNCIECFSNLMDRDEVLQKGIALKPGSGKFTTLLSMFEILYVIPCTSHEKFICNNCAKHSEMSQPSYCLLISSRGGFTISNSISADIVYKREPVCVSED
jgi:hypothetical protein